MSTPTQCRRANSRKDLKRFLPLLISLLMAETFSHAATIVWNGANSATDTNWSDNLNWVGSTAPGSSDDVKFFDLGAVVTASNVNSIVDLGFGGTIASLQYGQTNNTHTTLITNGATLNITGAGGLTVGTLTDNGVSQLVNATMTGAGALNINNAAAVLLVDQGKSANVASPTLRATLDMSGLASFTGNILAVSVGATGFGGANNVQEATGTLKLAQTNVITATFAGTAISANIASPTNSIQIGMNNGNAGGVNLFFLGQSNQFFIDSIGVGCLKTTASMLFNSGLNSPVAYFRGTNGASSRIRFWTVGDMSSSGSSSANCNGTNDFSGGTVDILVDTMSLGRDRQGGNTGTGVTRGTFIFTAGTVDVNNIYIGNQQFTTAANSNPMAGVVNVNGPAAVLKVNTNLYLGRTSIGSPAATSTSGLLNVTNGSVYANTIIVGTNSAGGSTTNRITLVSATLVITNTLATNASGLSLLSISNSTLGLTLAADASLRGSVQTLNTVGATNRIQLDPNPVIFPIYPTNIALIHYTNWTGSNTFVLSSVPAWAPNATIVSNGPNQTVDLSLPNDPRPVITGPPSGYSGNPGDNVTTNFAVVISGASVTPLSYSWYYYTNGATSTNLLANGAGPSGSSTIANATTANLTLSNAQSGDNGNYFVIVSNIYGFVSSTPVVLNISSGCSAPQISGGPNNQTVVQGNNATFSASVSANPAAYLQWQRGGVDITGSNSSTLVITGVQYPADDQAVFSLIATNDCGKVTNSAILTVIVPPVITNQPVSLVVTNTQSASFTVIAGGVPAPSYQWYKGTIANPIPNETNATFTIASVSPSDTGTYFAVVANAANSVTSSNATLTVNSTMSVVSLTPSNSATGICYDTPLTITFSVPPTLNNIGTIKIFNAASPGAPVDTLNLTLGNPQARSIGGTSFNSFPVIITNNTAKIYPHLGVMTSNQTYYVTIDDGAFKDSVGAFFAGITDTNAWRFTTKPSGPADPLNPVVAADGSADFVTVQGALDGLPTSGPARRTVNVRNGNYVEIVNVVKSNVTIRGQSRAGVIVSYANNNNMNPATATRMSFKVSAVEVAIENLTIINTTPQGGSQAEALMIDTGATHFILNNAEVDSRQDTILANAGTSQGYFYNSLVQGNFDYVWGGGNLFVTNCEIRTIGGTGTPNLAAPRTPNSNVGNWPGYLGNLVSNGFSFVSCQLTRAAGVTNCSMSGHNGATNGLVAYINCNIDTGCYTNADSTAQGSQLLWEYGCSNLNNTVALNNTASPFISFSELTNSDPRLLAAQNATVWLNGWAPQLAPNILTQPTNVTVYAGATASFTVSATGIPDAAYQWLQNGTNAPYPSANSATLTIANAQAGDAGTYSVIVSNSAGTVTSVSVTLTVVAPAQPVLNGTVQTLNDGNVQFSFSGTQTAGYRVWASTNINLTPIASTWTLISSGNFGASPVTFTDVDATNFLNRFYIISSP